LLLVFIVLDMVHRVILNTEWLSHLSPVYYYNLSKPLVPASSYGTNPGGMLVLLALSVLLSRPACLIQKPDILAIALESAYQ
jgi:polyether ionophore transport system permease protein